ncbi:MAG: hypothetical protein AABW84_00070 [Nanoarchaeota archaeon]
MVKRKTKRKTAQKRPARRKAVKKNVKRKAKVKSIKKPSKTQLRSKNLVGTVTHFFDNISVAVIDVKKPISVGDTISIEGPKTNFKQPIKSMQVEHTTIKTAKRGDNIGMKTNKPARARDLVYKI